MPTCPHPGSSAEHQGLQPQQGSGRMFSRVMLCPLNTFCLQNEFSGLFFLDSSGAKEVLTPLGLRTGGTPAAVSRVGGRKGSPGLYHRGA